MKTIEVDVVVEHPVHSKQGCINKIHNLLNETYNTSKIRTRGFEWVD